MIFDVKTNQFRPCSSFGKVGFGVKGKVELSNHIILPEAILQEAMHLLYEGVGKFLLKHIFMVKKYPCYLGKLIVSLGTKFVLIKNLFFKFQRKNV